MGEFKETIERIRYQEANINRIEKCLLEFREIWLNELVEDVNAILPPGKKIVRTVCVEAEEVDLIKRAVSVKPRFICKKINGQKYLTPIIPSKISDIGDVRTLCDKLLCISEGRELLHEEIKLWEDILKIINSYILKYDNGYETDIRALISESDPNRIMMLEESKKHIQSIQDNENQRIGAMNRLKKKTPITIKIKKGKFKEIEVGGESSSRNAHIDMPFVTEYISYNILNSSIKDRFFDNDNNEESELKFLSGQVYDELNKITLESLSIFNSFENKKGVGSIETMIIEQVEPLYKYIRKIRTKNITPSEMVVGIFGLSIEPDKIRRRFGDR